MGQIVSTAAKPKRCNKNQLSQLGVLAAGLHVLVSTDNSMNAAGQGNFDSYIVGDGQKSAEYLEVKSIDSKIIPVIGINLYDGNGTVDGQYIRNCVVPVDSSKEKLVLSTEGKNAAYFYNVAWIDDSGSQTSATYASRGYSQDESRMGNLYNIPSTAKFLKFDYRHTYSAGALIRKVMVTYGETFYNDYYPYVKTNILQNPEMQPYTEAALGCVYLSPTGDDSNGDGSFDSPFFSISRALQEGKRMIMRGGIYDYGWAKRISLEGIKYKKLEIMAYPNEMPVIFKGTKIATTATLMSGSTKVYEASVSYNPNARWIYQYGIADEKTLITDAERTAYHKGRTHRSPICTAIGVTDSITSIEQSDDYLYYFDSSSNKVYFSCPVAPSADNFIYGGYANAFGVTNAPAGWEAHFAGITFLGTACNIENSCNSVLENCRVYSSRYSGGFVIDNVKNATLKNCEVGYTNNGASAPSGDGINCHVDDGDSADYRLIDCWSHDSWNDGYSDHENSFAIIDGGLYEHNCIGGQGAGLTPAYGAVDVIRNVICQNNTRGIQYSATSKSARCGVYISNSVCRNNSEYGFSVLGNAKMEAVNCVAYGNGRGFGGSEYASIKLIGSKSANNTNADQYVDIVVP